MPVTELTGGVVSAPAGPIQNLESDAKRHATSLKHLSLGSGGCRDVL